MTRRERLVDPTLEHLEGEIWPDVDPSTVSGLVARCHALRKKPVREFTNEDLRMMISQRLSLLHLIPTALGRLERNPLIEGDCYEGDVLNAVVGCDAFLAVNLHLRQRVLDVVRRALAQVQPELPADVRHSLTSFAGRWHR